jgi:hypothetical protein
MTIEQPHPSAQPVSDEQASQLAQILSVQQEQLKMLQLQTERVVGAIQVLQQRSDNRNVAINAITMSFGDMVLLLVKIALASIPAAIIVLILCSIVLALLGGIFAAMLRAAF